MQKKISVLVSISITVLLLVACGSTNNTSSTFTEIPNGIPNDSLATEQITTEKIENDNLEVATDLKYLILPNNDCVIEGGLDMSRTAFNIFAFTTLTCSGTFFACSFCSHSNTSPTYFFLLAIVFFGPLRVRAFVFER